MLALLCMVLACVWQTGLYQHMTLPELKSAQASFAMQYDAQPVQTTLLYFAGFTLLTACCLPGALVPLVRRGFHALCSH